MKNRMLTAGEISTIRVNLREIEKNLGHPVPEGIIDYNTLKDRMLKPGDISIMCTNIRRITESRDSSKYYSGNPAFDRVYGIILLVIGIVGYIIQRF